MARRLCLALLLALGLAGCSREAASPPNVVLIVVDTLRADRLACYGDRKGLMPFLDSLADRAVVFDHAYAQSSWTVPSVASLMTSRYQAEDGMLFFDSALSPNEITLAEELQQHGYATGGFSANGFLIEQRGWKQGFDSYFSTLGRPPAKKGGLFHNIHADELNEKALAWLDGLPAEKRSPFFLYLQYMDPHIPYDPPKDILDRIFDGEPPPDPDRFSTHTGFHPEEKLDDATLRILEKLYDGEVMSADRGIRHLFEALGRRHLLDHTLVVITADHGNEFYDHGRIGHGDTLYNELIRVPLLVLMPGQTRRLNVAEPVGLVDVAPTLLREAGIPAPARYEGRSFSTVLDGARPGWRGRLSRLDGRRPEPRPIVSELLSGPFDEQPPDSSQIRSMILGSHKLIAGRHGEEAFYDLAADPGEKHPDALDPAARGKLRQALGSYRTHIAQEPSPPPPRKVDPEVLERLRALGYAN